MKTAARYPGMRGTTAGVQWNEAETLTGVDLVIKEIEDGVVVMVSSVTLPLDSEPPMALRKGTLRKLRVP